MGYVKGINRNQMTFTSLDTMVAEDSMARVIDAFVNSLDLAEYGFSKTRKVHYAGRPAYDPASLLKLYIYGNCNNIRSSRKLAKTCQVNVEVMWLMNAVEPDFRTISDFRKDNVDKFKRVFHEFNRRILASYDAKERGDIDSPERFLSVDGSKFFASNSKDRNFTQAKLDDRLKYIDTQVSDYLKQMNSLDDSEDLDEAISSGNFTKEQLEKKLKELNERKARYEGYMQQMLDEGKSQMSLTDSDAKLMKNKNGYSVSYNPQTAVDSDTHMILDYQMTNRATDHGLLASTVSGLREDGKILEVTADKGYHSISDMAECLENGIIPSVIPDAGSDGFVIETEYEKCDDAESIKDNTDAKSLKKCLRNGTVPEAYAGVISDISVDEVKYRVYEEDVEKTDDTGEEMTEEEYRVRAAEGFFVRDLLNNMVYCPGGEILRQKSTARGDRIRYANKLACKKCPYKDKCMKNRTSNKYPFKVVEMADKQIEKPLKGWNDIEKTEARRKVGLNPKYHMETKKVVRFTFKPKQRIMEMRKCLSEHPFGTIKRSLDGAYFLLRGMSKVDGEFALITMSYNLKRARGLLGYEELIKAVTA